VHKIGIVAALAILAGVPATMSVAATKSPKLARCDGRHRRPANMFGTILPSVDPQTGTVTNGPRPGIDVFEERPADGPKPPADGKPATIVPPIGALEPSKIYGSC
jgi:hypothetical protein